MTPPDEAWWGLWHEPWRDMHPGWWLRLAPHQDSLVETFRTGAPSARHAYAWFCTRFGIDTRQHFPGLVDHDLPGVPLDGKSLMAAALALGRVGYVSYCLMSSREGLARLFAPAASQSPDMDGWREALRQARARPLPLHSGQAPDTASSEQLRHWAVPLMARLMEDAAPGAWSRLRLRLPPDVGQNEVTPPLPAVHAPAVQRQAWRIWRASSQAQRPSSRAATAAPTNHNDIIPHETLDHPS